MSSGQHLGRDLVDAQAAGDRVGDGLGVAGDHRHPQPEGVEVPDGRGRFGPHLVLEAEQAHDLAVGDDVEHRPAVARPGLGGRDQGGRGLEPEVGDHAGPADRDVAPPDRGTSATSGQRLEGLRAGACEASLVGGAHDRPCQRVLGVRLHRRGEGQELVLVDARARQRSPPATGSPRVRVPVLSKMTTSSSRARSSARRSLTSRP